MGYIPPGSQVPFDPNRKYGQEPGFVSRHSTKIIVISIILLIAATFALYQSSPFYERSDEPADENRTERTR